MIYPWIKSFIQNPTLDTAGAGKQKQYLWGDEDAGDGIDDDGNCGGGQKWWCYEKKLSILE